MNQKNDSRQHPGSKSKKSSKIDTANEKWQKVREIFDAALRQKSDERRRFVSQACGEDKTLLAEVESLLSSLGSADSFMETPAVGLCGDGLLERHELGRRATDIQGFSSHFGDSLGKTTRFRCGRIVAGMDRKPP